MEPIYAFAIKSVTSKGEKSAISELPADPFCDEYKITQLKIK